MNINVINLKPEKPAQYVKKGSLLELHGDYLLFAQTSYGKFNFIDIVSGNRQMNEFDLSAELHDELITSNGLLLSDLVEWLETTWRDAQYLTVIEPSDIEITITQRS